MTTTPNNEVQVTRDFIRGLIVTSRRQGGDALGESMMRGLANILAARTDEELQNVVALGRATREVR